MKKRIRDLTVGEVAEFCKKYNCIKCPLFRFYEMCEVSFDLTMRKSNVESILKRVIEIPNEPVGNSDQLEEE